MFIRFSLRNYMICVTRFFLTVFQYTEICLIAIITYCFTPGLERETKPIFVPTSI